MDKSKTSKELEIFPESKDFHNLQSQTGENDEEVKHEVTMTQEPDKSNFSKFSKENEDLKNEESLPNKSKKSQNNIKEDEEQKLIELFKNQKLETKSNFQKTLSIEDGSKIEVGVIPYTYYFMVFIIDGDHFGSIVFLFRLKQLWKMKY